MKKLTALFVVVLLLMISATPVVAITWGEPDTAHTNVGALVVNDPNYGLWQLCSGTLINPRVFLTAGHCTIGLESYDNVWVNFDQYALNPGTLIEVEEVITHPYYYWGPSSNPYDVGALILKEPVTDIVPANLPDEWFLDKLRKDGALNQGRIKGKFTVVGYGGLLEWPPPQIFYKDGRQSAVSEFRALLKAWLRLSQNHATGDGGTCYGDSGGPTFWKEPDGTEILVGITSWGDTECVSSEFNYRVDIPETLDFIDAVINSLPK